MPDLSRGLTPPLFNLPKPMLEKAVLNVVYMLRNQPEVIPDMLEALGLTEFAAEMVA